MGNVTRLQETGDEGLGSTGERFALHLGPVVLTGDLTVPDGARGTILFAQGGGSRRGSTRDRGVARLLNDQGFATLLLDLLTLEERVEDAVTRHLRYDVPLLGRRTVAATDWLADHEATHGLPVGYLGSSVGAAAVLTAAAQRQEVGAVVVRGGRPDLAGPALANVMAPTLFVVGGQDTVLEERNLDAMHRMTADVGLAVVAGSSHRFESDASFVEATALAIDWFDQHLMRWVSPTGGRVLTPLAHRDRAS